MTGLAQRLAPPGSVPYPGNHLGLRWRPMIGRDAPAVYALICLIEDEDQTIRRTSVGDIADMMEGKNGRDWVDTIVGLDAKANICAVASVRRPARHPRGRDSNRQRLHSPPLARPRRGPGPPVLAGQPRAPDAG